MPNLFEIACLHTCSTHGQTYSHPRRETILNDSKVKHQLFYGDAKLLERIKTLHGLTPVFVDGWPRFLPPRPLPPSWRPWAILLPSFLYVLADPDGWMDGSIELFMWP